MGRSVCLIGGCVDGRSCVWLCVRIFPTCVGALFAHVMSVLNNFANEKCSFEMGLDITDVLWIMYIHIEK